MRSKLRASLLVSGLSLVGMLFAMPASAHHSVQAEFDIHKSVMVTGTVLKIEAIDPHSYLTIMVKDASGNEQRWGFEFGGPRQLRQAGLGKDGLKPGDQVTVEALAAKDGSTNGYLEKLTVDGKVYNVGAHSGRARLGYQVTAGRFEFGHRA